MRLLKWIAGILLILIIWNVVFKGGMSLHSIGQKTMDTIETAGQTEAGQIVKERTESWFEEIVQLVWDGFENVVTGTLTDVINENGGTIGPGNSGSSSSEQSEQTESSSTNR